MSTKEAVKVRKPLTDGIRNMKKRKSKKFCNSQTLKPGRKLVASFNTEQNSIDS